MKLSEYAKINGVTYRTAWNWYKSGILKGFQMPSGTIIVQNQDNIQKKSTDCTKAVLYARVSSNQQKDDLARQSERLFNYAVAKGYCIVKNVKEIGSGLNDSRQKLNQILVDNINDFDVIIIEHKDRLTRFGFNYINMYLESKNKSVEIINRSIDENHNDLIQDFVSIITSFCARLYGQRRSKRKTELLIRELEK
jgi:predicted site-specific integrase-resolvase